MTKTTLHKYYCRVRAFRPVLNPRNKNIVKRTVVAYGAEDALFQFNQQVPVQFEHYTFQMGGRVS